MSSLVISLVRGPLIECFTLLSVGPNLYGITCLQTLFYFQTYVDDRRSLRLTFYRSKMCIQSAAGRSTTVSMHAFTFTFAAAYPRVPDYVLYYRTLETVHVALSTWLLDYYLVANYADELALQSATWFATYSIGSSTRGYYDFCDRIVFFDVRARQLFHMESMEVYGKIMDYYIHDGAASGFATGILSVLSSTWVTYLQCSRGLIFTRNALFVIRDIFSASTMAWYPNKSRNDTPRCLICSSLTNLAGSLLPKATPNKSITTGGITALLNILFLVFPCLRGTHDCPDTSWVDSTPMD
ncbi:hypothetical protein EDD16DRAFT_1521249 [Pisolithus croceorrhizus]|nr:hypothetical protein EDD16DRAFT_1521249 [Pisolithus croceorrhizus]KAI6134233.1 hypothetical protein EV401DRAFT_1882779 [Pisolithus croceorrhizus]KAI6143552.1 hypothetical protein EDD17DRAFT_1515525 [Pisolithus thermaeus]